MYNPKSLNVIKIRHFLMMAQQILGLVLLAIKIIEKILDHNKLIGAAGIVFIGFLLLVWGFKINEKKGMATLFGLCCLER